MKRILVLLLAMTATDIVSMAYARNAADIVFYHYRATLEHQENVDHYSLFPQEKEISHFPLPVSENETDLAILHQYYENVVVSYKTYLEKELTPKLVSCKQKMASQHGNLHLATIRNNQGKNQFSRPLMAGRGETNGQDRIDHKARIQAIRYYSTHFKKLSDLITTLNKKADFYAELAETSEELYKGEIH